MSTAPSAIVPDLSTRRAPAFGGFNLTALKLEIRRLLRNRRTVIIAIVAPIVLLLRPGPGRTATSQQK
jgi:ABC-2 type transport system permease protein